MRTSGNFPVRLEAFQAIWKSSRSSEQAFQATWKLSEPFGKTFLAICKLHIDDCAFYPTLALTPVKLGGSQNFQYHIYEYKDVQTLPRMDSMENFSPGCPPPPPLPLVRLAGSSSLNLSWGENSGGHLAILDSNDPFPQATRNIL